MQKQALFVAVLASSLVMLLTGIPTNATIGGDLATITTTLVVTYNYASLSNGTTIFGGYLTSITTVMTVNETATSRSTSTTPTPSVEGFPAEAIIAGVSLGIFALLLTRTRQHRADLHQSTAR